MGLTRRSKPMFTRHPDSSHITLAMTAQDMTIVSKMDHTIVVGLPKLRVSMQNPSVMLAPPGANRARDKVTQRVASS
jgi:hypothetical protein